MFNPRLSTLAAVALMSGLAAPQLAAAQDAAAPAATAPAAPAAAKVVPAGDLVETARASGQFTTLIKALDATGLTPVLKAQKGIAVFAPTDAAFAALPAGELNKLMTTDRGALQQLLLHHVVTDLDSSKVAGTKGPVKSLLKDDVYIDGSEGGFKADNATVVQADVKASNGTMHVVNEVLKPGFAASAVAAEPAPAEATAAPAPSGG